MFAEHMPLAEHLARHHAADLFLDTVPCNAHTTASDALWAGLPLLTCAGDSFASRVAASLLTAVGLPQLIAPDGDTYEGTAIALARDSKRLATLRTTLASNRKTAPLFNTARVTRQVEAAFLAMHERHISGLAPAHMAISEGAA